jgi:hypothetical protein
MLWRVILGVLVLLVLGIAGRAYLSYAREPHLTPECAAAYANARSARDTAAADAFPVSKRDPVMRSCGMLRRLVEARGALAHPR